MTILSLGVDTGGTFTDLVLLDRTAGVLAIHKLPTTPDDPARGILDGIAVLLDEAGHVASTVELLVHGTTLATNAILQRRHAKTGMLVTQGFRDVLEIGRQRRPAFYNLDVSKPEPPVTRDCIHEIPGRLDETGAEVLPLDENVVRSAVMALRQTGVEAIAICFIHAYANPAHEGYAADSQDIRLEVHATELLRWLTALPAAVFIFRLTHTYIWDFPEIYQEHFRQP